MPTSLKDVAHGITCRHWQHLLYANCESGFKCCLLLRRCSVLSLSCSRNISVHSNNVAGRAVRMHSSNMLRALVLICAQLVYVYELNSLQPDPKRTTGGCCVCVCILVCVCACVCSVRIFMHSNCSMSPSVSSRSQK